MLYQIFFIWVVYCRLEWIFSSYEPKAQMSSSDQNLSVVVLFYTIVVDLFEFGSVVLEKNSFKRPR